MYFGLFGVVLALTEGVENWGMASVAGTLVVSVIWFVRHIVTVSLPKMQDHHSDLMKTALAIFSQEQKDARTMHREEIAAERTSCERRHSELIQACRDWHAANTDRLERIENHVRKP